MRRVTKHDGAVAVALIGAALMVSVLGGPAGAAVTDGMLKAGDVGLSVASKPHRSTVIAIDAVTADCRPGEDVEHEARVEGFAESTGNPASGAQLNQVVFDLGSTNAAKSFFAELRENEELRVQCGSTERATNFDLAKGPGGVGDARFLVTSNEKVAGATRKVLVLAVRTGPTVTALIFLDWDKSLPTTASVAKLAVARLG